MHAFQLQTLFCIKYFIHKINKQHTILFKSNYFFPLAPPFFVAFFVGPSKSISLAFDTIESCLLLEPPMLE